MFNEYIEFYKTYTQKYGPKTAIFLMVGSFYELYDIQNVETGETQCNVTEIVNLLGIQLSSKKGEFGPNKNGLFAGFPDYAMHKWASRLTSENWTVVIVDQIKDSRGKVKERKVSRILSPSTHIENTSSTDIPYVVTLYFHNSPNGITFGAGALDVTTGTTRTYFGTANGTDVWTADDLVQFLSVFPPKELIIYWRSTRNTAPDKSFFNRMFGITSIPVHIRSVETTAFAKELVRSEYFQKIYAIKSVLPAKTYLGLRTEYEEFALVYLLQFVEEHYPSMLKSFHRNEPWIPTMRLICGNHALTQLQITGHNQAETVIGLFDKCITSMGKRAMKERLLMPYSDPDQIRSYLSEVQDYTMWPEDKSLLLQRQLRFMYDLPRLHRKLLCGLITPQEIAGLFQTYAATEQISQLAQDTLLKAPFSSEDMAEYMTIFKQHFSEEKAKISQSQSQDVTPFNTETYKDINEKEQEIQAILHGFQTLRREIAQHANLQEDAIRLEEREKEPYGLKASTITLQQLKKGKLPDGCKISELKSGGWIDCTKLQQLNTKLQKLREVLGHLVKIHIVEACQQISESGTAIWSIMEQWIQRIDCTQCIAVVSKDRGFTCPAIEQNDNGSGVDIVNVRHPLVEASSTRVSYVKHNVKLGYTQDNQVKGWLVYGMNASGKSTLMKATGICILLAQAGCFVPAKEMTLRPFRAVYTRILNQDNLFAGLSSFAVEMSELRDILRNATKYTLVLGDELCSGTESISAQALVASGIKWLSDRNATFIFATHLHDLPKLVTGIEVWHLHVEYDLITKKLVYDRSLRPGSGSTLYGLEVARAMDLPFEFIEHALENRHRIMGSTTQEKSTPSSWNKDIIRKECEVCKAVDHLEVHHIVPRSSAVNNVLSDGTHMNDKRNLIVICQSCHDKVHDGSLHVGEVKVTSDGPERVVSEVGASVGASVGTVLEPGLPHQSFPSVSPSQSSPSQKLKKTKWQDEELETIMNTLRTYSSLSLKSIKAHLNSKHEIDISESMLGKMRRDL